MDKIEDCISFLIGKAGQQMARRSRERLSAHGVTPTQFGMLKVLWDGDGQSGSEIGGRLSIDSATITGVADRLEAAALLERRPDGGDRRVNRLFLTEKGKKLRQPLEAAMDALNAEISEELGARAKVVWSALRDLGDNRG